MKRAMVYAFGVFLAAGPVAASDFGLNGLPWRYQPGQPDLTQPPPPPLPPTRNYVVPTPDNNGGIDWNWRYQNFGGRVRPNNPGGFRIEGGASFRFP